jgi:hypothetical protein
MAWLVVFRDMHDGKVDIEAAVLPWWLSTQFDSRLVTEEEAKGHRKKLVLARDAASKIIAAQSQSAKGGRGVKPGLRASIIAAGGRDVGGDRLGHH